MQAGDDEAGFAFDGDGDRMLAVDRNGVVVDGDELIALAAHPPARRGPPAGQRRGRDGDDQLRLPHGDGRARRRGRDHRRSATATCSRRCASATGRSAASSPATSSTATSCPSGDGIAAALLTLEALGGADLADRHAMEKLPQTLVNVRVRDRGALEQAAEVHAAVERESAALEGRGRVLLRPSGTEPLVRVMVEAPTAEEAEARAGAWSSSCESQLGVEQAWTDGQRKLGEPDLDSCSRASARRAPDDSRRKEARPCAASSATSDSGRFRRSSSPAWRSSSTADTTPPGISIQADGSAGERARRRQPRRR